MKDIDDTFISPLKPLDDRLSLLLTLSRYLDNPNWTVDPKEIGFILIDFGLFLSNIRSESISLGTEVKEDPRDISDDLGNVRMINRPLRKRDCDILNAFGHLLVVHSKWLIEEDSKRQAAFDKIEMATRYLEDLDQVALHYGSSEKVQTRLRMIRKEAYYQEKLLERLSRKLFRQSKLIDRLDNRLARSLGNRIFANKLADCLSLKQTPCVNPVEASHVLSVNDDATVENIHERCSDSDADSQLDCLRW